MDKLVFAHQLRGVAALLIVITHYFGVYFGAPQVVAALTFSPDLHFVAPSWVAYWDFPFFKGPFGVAVFFLISGFVIPFSLRHNTAGSFLLARAWRIYPTYIASLALGMLAAYAAARHWGQPFGANGRDLLLNALLVHNLAAAPSLDAINWTLAIELKFYLLAALCSAAFLRRMPAFFLAAIALVVGLDLALPTLQALPALHAWQAGLAALVSDLNYLLFMLIGVLFHQHHRGILTAPWLVGGVAALLAGFLAAWRLGPQADQVPVIGVYYVYALAVFSLCYLLRARFRRQRLLDFLADISYPLYAVHALVGYTLLKLLMERGLGFGPAVALVLALVLGLAWLLHKGVEAGSSAYGKRLAAALARRGGMLPRQPG